MKFSFIDNIKILNNFKDQWENILRTKLGLVNTINDNQENKIERTEGIVDTFIDKDRANTFTTNNDNYNQNDNLDDHNEIKPIGSEGKNTDLEKKESNEELTLEVEEINFKPNRSSIMNADKDTQNASRNSDFSKFSKDVVATNRTSILNDDFMSAVRTAEFNLIKYTKESLIEINDSVENNPNIIKFWNSLNESQNTKESCKYIYVIIVLNDYSKYLTENLNLINDTQKNTFTLMALSVLLAISLIYTYSSTLFFIILPILVIAFKTYINKLNKNNAENSSNNNSYLNCNSNKIIKISSVFNESSKEILNYFNNFKTYKEWNKYVVGVSDIGRDENSVKFLFVKETGRNGERGDFELKIKRKVHVSSCYTSIKEYSEIENKNTIVRYILIEKSLKQEEEKCKVTFFIPLKIFSENKLHLNFLKSSVKALDLLHFYLKNKNFNKEEEEFTFNINANDSRNPSLSAKSIKSILKKQIVEIKEEKIPEEKTFAVELEEQNKSVVENEVVDEKNVQTIQPEETKLEETQTGSKIIEQEVSKEDKELIDLITAKKSELDGFLNKEWKVMEQKNDYKLNYFDEKDGIRSIKSETVINASLQKCWETLNDFSIKSKYDKNFETGHIIKEITPEQRIIYNKYKGKLGVSPREFIMIVNHTYKPEEGYGLIIACSLPNSDKFPRDKKIERADLKIGGYLIKKVDENKTSYCNYNCVNIIY